MRGARLAFASLAGGLRPAPAALAKEVRSALAGACAPFATLGGVRLRDACRRGLALPALFLAPALALGLRPPSLRLAGGAGFARLLVPARAVWAAPVFYSSFLCPPCRCAPGRVALPFL